MIRLWQTCLDPRPASDQRLTKTLEDASEAILIGLACLTPWAYGSVDAWAELAIGAAIAVLAILEVVLRWRTGHSRSSTCLPSLALAGLALLAAFQAIPLPARVLALVAPSNQALRASLIPDVPVFVKGDPNPAVPRSTAAVSLDPESTWHAAAELAGAWILFQCVWGRRGSYTAFRRFGMLIAGNAALLTLFSMAQALTWSGKIYGIRPSLNRSGWMTGGPFVCHNHLAAYLNLGLGFAMGFLLASRRTSQGEGLLKSREWGRQTWAAYASGLIVVGVLASHSRGGFLAMMASALVTFVVLRPRAVHLWVGMATMLVLVATFLIAVGSASPFQRLGTIVSYATEDNTRIEIWRGTFQAWREHPIVGLGLGTFSVTVAPYFHNDRGVFFSHAENEYLQILAEGGIIGFGLAMTALFGVARLGRRAMIEAPSSSDRAVVMGAMFGVLALAAQSLGDFAPRIPGVGIPAVILCAYLARLGQDALHRDRSHQARSSSRTRSWIGSVLGGLAIVGLSLAILVHCHHRERAEALVVGAGLPLPGVEMPAVELEFPPDDDLKPIQTALERALRERPDWAEGHIRLGMIRLGLYQRMTVEWLATCGYDPATSALLADPLWLHEVVRRVGASPWIGDGGLANHEPVRRHLVPAARCFLEARRCCPVLALPHARLASLDFLLGAIEGSAHADRALRMAGSESEVLALTAEVAAQAGDLGQASRCWRRMLEIGGTRWLEVADAAGAWLSPEQILQDVVPVGGGRDPLRIADRLYAAPEDDKIRLRFLSEVLERAPHDPNLTLNERTWLEGQAKARLNDRVHAMTLMKNALDREPARNDRREEYAAWLLEWDEPEEAVRQARIGLHYNPGQAGLFKTLKAAIATPARPRNPRPVGRSPGADRDRDPKR